MCNICKFRGAAPLPVPPAEVPLLRDQWQRQSKKFLYATPKFRVYTLYFIQRAGIVDELHNLCIFPLVCQFLQLSKYMWYEMGRNQRGM